MLLVDWLAASGLWGSCSPRVKGHFSWGHLVPDEEGQGKDINPRWNDYSLFFTVDFSACLHQMKVARLLKYLQFRDYKSKLFRSLEDDDLLSDTGIYAASDSSLPFISGWFIMGRDWILSSCRRNWCRSTAAAAGSGFSHLDGSNGWLPVTGRAPGRWPH